LDVNGFNLSTGSLTGSGSIDNLASSSATLTVGNADVAATFSGSILSSVGSLALTKVGTGTLVLSGTDNYTGGTTVLGGKLKVNSVNGLADGSNLSVGVSLGLFPDAIVPPSTSAPAVENSATESSPLPVPEPGTMALVAAAALLAIHSRWRNRRRTTALEFRL
jgi:autotransporter-associated beta strand protein